MLKIKNKICIILILSFVCITQAFAEEKKIALYGQAKYDDDFAHFSYVNADAKKGGRLVMPEYGGFDNFNPFIFKGSASGTVADLIWDSLGVTPTDDIGVVYPLIAKAFEWDETHIDFILDERAQFADGSKVTADDVIFSFDVLINKGAPIYRAYYGDVEKAEKISENRVRFYFREGAKNKELPLILAQLKIFPKKDWISREFDKPSLQIPLGGGPYKIKNFQAGKYIVLERDKNYWAKDLPSRKGFFNFDEIRIDYYQDTTVTLQALFAGNIDVREEYIAKIWATAYDNDLVKSGKVIKKAFEHKNPAVLQHFAINLRKDKFKNKNIRRALDLAFNFDFANEKLFYRAYNRLYSYFTNTGFEATGLPTGLEKEILEQYRDKLDESVFTTPFSLPDNASPEKLRANLKEAVNLFKKAGYEVINGKMRNVETGEPFEFEILSNSANGTTFTRVMLPYIHNLEKIGVKATFRNLEVNVFKNRMDHFDFDVAIMSYRISAMPGNELKEMYGSKAADINGSYNIAGIKNEVVDDLINHIVAADKKEEYAAYIKALDRVLLSEYYVVFQWYSPYNRVGYLNKFGIPEVTEPVGFQPLTWWAKEVK
ncbi:MAG: ABC transporter substrate-binding protein [Alphaproteobacteria bacterium]|nr:ABC transporter substrate-binding protein [Alphaproteobacteria bacterium]